MARSEGADCPPQHLAAAIAAAFARAEQPGEHLAVHASKLVVKPRLQILRRHRRSLLLRLEHPHRPAVEDHVDRTPRLGLHRSINVRIGINLVILIAGGLVGWVVGMLITPVSPKEQAVFSDTGRALSIFVAGYLVAKIDRI